MCEKRWTWQRSDDLEMAFKNLALISSTLYLNDRVVRHIIPESEFSLHGVPGYIYVSLASS
jgi:hypothetical protein